MNIRNLIIRPANNSDLIEIQQLFVDTISAICTGDYSPGQIKAWTSSIDNTQGWLDKINRQFFLIALIENKIVGFGSLENGDYLDMMYIHKDYQRQGIAGKLLHELETKARENGHTVIHSYVSKTARLFFEQNGFKIIAENVNKIKGVEIMNYKMRKVM